MSGLVSHLSTSIGQDVVPGCVAIAKFNPEEPKDQIAVACRGGKVCVYNLSELAARTTTYYKPVTVIDVKDEVISIAAAPWKTATQKYQLLLIASSSTIQLYDIYENHSLFHRILPDEIRTISIGCVAEKTESWILTGGESSITGFDKTGSEVYWNVSSDAVNAICFVDLIGKNYDQIVVGTTDQEITIYDHEELTDTRTEVSQIALLTRVGADQMAYALQNGTIGVYQRLNRLWRVKSKSTATCQCFYKPNKSLLTGWESGRWEMRKMESGEIIYKSQIECSVAKVVAHSFSTAGDDLLVFGQNGSIEVFLPPTEIDKKKRKAVDENEALRKIEHRRQILKKELDHVEMAQKTMTVSERVEQNVIPRNVKLSVSISNSKDGLYVSVSVDSDLKIFLLVFLSEGLFGNEEAKTEVFPAGKQELRVHIAKAVSSVTALGIKAGVGYSGSKTLHVLEEMIEIPIFAHFVLNDVGQMPLGKVEFPFSERPQRFFLWLKENFLLADKRQLSSNNNAMCFKSPSGEKVCFHLAGDKLLIYADTVKWASDAVQSLASYFGINDMSSICDFPEIKEIEGLFQEIADIQASLVRIDSDIAEITQGLMSSLVRLEDSRLLEDWKSMEQVQSMIMNADSDLMLKQRVRHANRDNLTKILKKLNHYIDSGSKLRIGKEPVKILNVCRQAVKTKKPKLIVRTLLHGAN
ncbi:unnamed protein product [Oikopleura dioica]|uniref:Bardet-Biedl syndrome 2 protein homolog n=1 Tax=Oikopleura dioica TaxID=34765 RepID=E4X4Q3_OIKDI|nr:unnamed protein product [Oikopleura dioica]